MIRLLTIILMIPVLCSAQSSAMRSAMSNAAHRYTDEPNNTNTHTLTPIDYYVFWGQSNGVGRDSVGNMGAQYSYLTDTIPGTKISFEGSLFETLVSGESTEPDRQTRDFGPEVSLMDTLFKSDGDTVYILKYAVGSTWLAERPSNSDWNVNSSGDLFNGLISRIDLMHQTLQSLGYDPTCVAVIGMQGENDAIDLADAQTYDTNLEEFIDSIRNYYSDPGLPFIFGEVNGINDPVMTYRDTVRQAQYDVIRYEINSSGTSSDTGYTRDHTYLVDTDTYTFMDVVHYDANSTIQFGWDIFRALEIAGIIPLP